MTTEPTHIEVSVPMWDEMQKAERRTVRSLITLVVGVLFLFAACIGFLTVRSYESQTRQACIATVTGSALGRAFDALAAPPVAPNLTPAQLAKTARGVAVKRGLEDAHKLENIDRYC